MIKHKPVYWIEIKYSVIDGKRMYRWIIKACNGRVKGGSNLYKKRSYCINDAKSFCDVVGLEIREK